MTKSRRDFLQLSATAAAAASLKPFALGDGSRPRAALGAAAERPEDIKAFEAKMLRARPVPLQKVRLTGGPLKATQDATAKYLLSLEPDRMMAFYRMRAGLSKKAEPYGGWDGPGRNLTGHIAGHHLSAVSLMYLATGDAKFKERADYLVGEMKEVQDKMGDGLLSGLETIRDAFSRLSQGEIRSAAFDLNGVWSPWYTLHKTYAGLRDAYRHTGNRTALEMEVKYAVWAEKVLAPLSGEQVQRSLNTEHGGMNEVLADLYADTGDKRWLALSLRFEHHAFTDPLKRHQDNLSGKHGNCQIPKLIGSAARYGYTGDPADLIAASFFFDRVAQHHSYATGGHGLAEYFGEPDKLSPRVDGRTSETCNVYNMLKLARRLFSLKPDALYADFYERALFNHYLASCDPDDYHTSYMVPVGRGVQQEYQQMLQSFTCCVGTGMEGHALHGLGVVNESPDAVWVSLFAPLTAELSLPARGQLAMETAFPEGDSAKIALTLQSPKEFSLFVRRPYWAGDGFAVRVNGSAVEQPPFASLRDAAAGGRGNAPGNEAATAASTFVELKRTWKSGDTVELAIPKTVLLEPTPDNKTVAALMWGPIVLAGDHGPRLEGRGAAAAATPIPALVAADRPVTEWVTPAGTRDGNFTARQVARVVSAPAAPADLPLTPFYRTHQRRYSVYFDVVTPREFDARTAAYSAERERIRKMEAATIAFVQPGDAAAERDYSYKSDPADRALQRNGPRQGRGGTGWFSFDLPVDPQADTTIVVTHFNELGLPWTGGSFDILVDGTPVAKFEPPGATTSGFYDVQYAVPGALTRGKARVTIRFEAAPNNRIAPVFGVRTVRAGGG